MAVIEIEDLESRSGWSLSGGRTYTCTLRVETDDPATGGKAVIDALNLFDAMAYRWPLTAETPTESDARCLLADVDAEPTSGDRKQWRATLRFESRTWDGRQEAIGPDGRLDPFAVPPALRSYGEDEEFGLAYARDGAPILNSAGEPFEQVPTIALPVVTYEVSRLERTFDADLIAAIQGRVNASAWLGFPAESVLCRAINSERTWSADAGGWAWATTYKFAIKRSLVSLEASGIKIRPGWRLQVLDCGFRELVGGELVAIMDKSNAPVAAPVNLNGSGARLPASGTPVYKEFDIYPTADFSALDMPEDLFTAGSPEV